MATSAPMIVPLARWTRSVNPEIRPFFAGPVTAVTANDSHLVTGLRDGRVWIYSREKPDPSGAFNFAFKILCVGHRTAVTALALVEVETDAPSNTETVVLSASEDGVLMKWAVADGRCLQCNPSVSAGTITRLTVFPESIKVNEDPALTPPQFVMCSGETDEIPILNASSLEITRSWNGHSNWVSCSLLPDEGPRYLLTCSVVGVLSLWSFDESGTQPVKAEPLTYDTAMLSNAGHISGLMATRSTDGAAVAIGPDAIIIFRVTANRAVKSFEIPRVTPMDAWIGAQMLHKSQLLAWTAAGKIFHYDLSKISSNQVIGKPTRRHCCSTNFSQLSHSRSDATDSAAVYLKMPPPPSPKKKEGTEPEKENTVPEKENTVAEIENTVPELFLVANLPEGPSLVHWRLPFESFPDTATGSFTEEGSSERNHGRLMPTSEQDVMALWPIQAQESVSNDITAAIIVKDHILALGYENGSIHICSITTFLNGTTRETAKAVLQYHSGAISVLLALDPSLLAGKHYLLSGGTDFAVCVWNLDTGELLASFKPHMDAIISFVQPPADAGARMKGCILSVAKDNSVAIISMEELNCLYIFPGHLHTISVIQWRPTEDYILFGFDDGSLFVWQLRTAHLDRIETGTIASNIVHSSTCSIKLDRIDMNKREKLDRNGISISPIFVNNQDLPYLHVLLINNKKLVEDTHRRSGQIPHKNRRAQSGSPSNLYQQDDEEISSPITSKSNSLENISLAEANSQNTLPRIVSPRSSSLRINSGDNSGNKSPKSSPSPSRLPKTPQSKKLTETNDSANQLVPNYLSVARTVLSALLSWRLDLKMDHCARSLLLLEADECLTFGLRGANGSLSLQAPTGGHPSKAWTVSHHVTSARLLALISLARSFAYAIGANEKGHSLIGAYTNNIPQMIGENYMHPSLSYLAKYWLDSSSDTQSASRRIISSTLKQLSDDKKIAIVAHWHSYLPSVASPLDKNRSMARSAVVLGIIGAENPGLLTTRACKDVALSLTLLMNENHRTSYQLAAMELCAKGFTTWEPHFNAGAVIRTLLALSSSATSTPVQVKSAQRALVQTGTANTTLFVTAITYDLIHSKLAADKISILKVISYFIYKNRTALHPLLPRVVEAVVKALDPNIHNMRENILKTATGTLHDLVKFYPSVSFHGGSQRLAVGTLEGATILYDLRTATRWHVLEGHSKPVTAVAFSPDGRYVATASCAEASVKVWHPSAGLLGMIAGSMHSSSMLGATSTKPMRGFVIQDEGLIKLPPEKCLDLRLEWHKEGSFQLRSLEHNIGFKI